MEADGRPTWSFLTNHAQVLLCIAHDPRVRLRDIGEAVGITERAAHRIVAELVEAGYVSRRRAGRRNQYGIQAHLTLPDPLAREQKIGDLLAVLGHQGSPPADGDQPQADGSLRASPRARSSKAPRPPDGSARAGGAVRRAGRTR